MYLYAKKCVSNYDFSPKDEKEKYKLLLSVFNLNAKDIQLDGNSLNIEINVAYWRKANQIHNWFVDNVQNGIDNCQSSYVTREQLKELVCQCKAVLKGKSKSKAKNILPSTTGLFFGSTDYDEYYFEDLKYTIKQINYILNNPKFDDWDFYYQASW